MGQVSTLSEFVWQHTSLLSIPPLLQMSADSLRERADLFLKSFPGETSYAVKANCETCVLDELVKAGIKTFDVASPLEMQLVRNVLPDAILHYHNPARSKQEMNIALHAYDCRRFSIDHLNDLNDLYQQVIDPTKIEVAIRFRMETQSEAVQSFKSKFGVLRDEAAILLKTATQMGFKTGLTFHPGSQTISPSPYREHIKEAGLISHEANTSVTFLNVGGGFPSYYRELHSSPLPEFFEAIKNSVERFFPGQAFPLECEPGRALVAASGTLVTEIKTVRHDKRELFLNDGIYGGLMEFYQFPSLAPHYEYAGQNNTEYVDWTVYGPTCDPVDCLPNKLRLPVDVQTGEKIMFYGVGAYSTATATRFNGYGAIEVQLV